MKFGLSLELIQQINSVVAKHSAKAKIILFGSRATNTHNENSDIDLVISGKLEPVTVEKIKTELNKLSTPYKLDVLHYESIDNPALKAQIDKAGKPLK